MCPQWNALEKNVYITWFASAAPSHSKVKQWMETDKVNHHNEKKNAKLPPIAASHAL